MPVTLYIEGVKVKVDGETRSVSLLVMMVVLPSAHVIELAVRCTVTVVGGGLVRASVNSGVLSLSVGNCVRAAVIKLSFVNCTVCVAVETSSN